MSRNGNCEFFITTTNEKWRQRASFNILRPHFDQSILGDNQATTRTNFFESSKNPISGSSYDTHQSSLFGRDKSQIDQVRQLTQNQKLRKNQIQQILEGNTSLQTRDSQTVLAKSMQKQLKYCNIEQIKMDQTWVTQKSSCEFNEIKRMINKFKKSLPKYAPDFCDKKLKNFKPTLITNVENSKKKDQFSPLKRYATSMDIYPTQIDTQKRNKQQSEVMHKLMSQDDFKVLKSVHKDILLNHDMFFSKSVKVQSNEFIEHSKPFQQESFALTALQKVLEARSWPRNQIDIDHQLAEASFIYRRIVKSLDSCGISDNLILESLQKELCLLWMFIVTSLDTILFKQQDQISELNQKIDVLVKEQVMVFEAKLQHQIRMLQATVTNLREELNLKANTIDLQNQEISLLQQKLKEEGDKLQSFKDPDGCQLLRKTLQDFEKDIQCLSQEKLKQYKGMRKSLRLIENINLNETEYERVQNLKQFKREAVIKQLQSEQMQLAVKLDSLRSLISVLKDQPVFVRRLKKPEQAGQNKTDLQGFQSSDEIFAKLNIQLSDQEKIRDAIQQEMLDSLQEEESRQADKNVSKTLDNQTIRKIKNEAYLELQKQLEAFLIKCDQSDLLLPLIKNFFQMSLTERQRLLPKSTDDMLHELKSLGSRLNQDRSFKNSQSKNIKNAHINEEEEYGSYDDEKDDDGYYDEEDYGDESDLSQNIQQKQTKKQKNNKNSTENQIISNNQIDEAETRVDELNKLLIKLKSTQITGKLKYRTPLVEAAPTQRKKVRDVEDNPIINAVYQALNMEKQQLTEEHFLCMLNPQIYSIMDQLIQDKVYFDLEIQSGPVQERKPVSFATFMFDSMLMQYGLYNIAIKILMQMVNGLKVMTSNTPFGYLIAQVCGLALPKLRQDEVQITLRCHTFFKIVQANWIKKMRVNFKELEISEYNESNMVNGGECSIFEILFELKKACKEHPSFAERVLSLLRPDFFFEKDKMNQTLLLEFSMLKIINRVARLGKDIKELFKEWDTEKNGWLGANQMLKGINLSLGIVLSREESHLLGEHLDKNGDGQISFQNFCEKISYRDFQRRSHRFLISEKLFTEKILNEWFILRAEERQKIQEKLMKFDENGDNIFQYDEFEQLMKTLEPQMTQRMTLLLFKQALSVQKNQGGPLDALTVDTCIDLVIIYNVAGSGRLIFGAYLESKRSQYKEAKKNKKK